MTATSSAMIMVVEDEPSIGQGLCDVLVFRGHRVCWAKDGQQALQLSREERPDLVLLDLMLPQMDGYSVCRELRTAGQTCGIIMLTAKGSEEDILAGFESGADDYVTKPFSISQLLARVEAVLGRSRRNKTEPVSGLGLRLRPDLALLESSRGAVELSAREIAVLRLLLTEPHRIVSRRVLLREAWGMNNVDGLETRTVDVHMAKLRKKLAETSDCTIQAVRGQGYRLIHGAEHE
jgi:DNA-binding response OmpR family regulator